MIKSNAYRLWLDVGYDLFSYDGTEGLQVERLARVAGLNKSGYYHYFGDKDTFLSHLIERHQEYLDAFVSDIVTIQNIDNEYLLLLIKYRTTLLAQRQFILNKGRKTFSKALESINEKIDSALFPLWKEYVCIHHHPDLAYLIFPYIRDMFITQLNEDTFELDCLQEKMREGKKVIQEILKERPIMTSSRPYKMVKSTAPQPNSRVSPI
jgi:AcrR family transcriptional regulator